MGRGALLTGVAGGIIGTIASVLGFIWSILISFVTVNYLPIGPLGLLPMYTGPSTFQITITILFVALLAVSCILTGVGFYGMYTVSQSSMGVVGLIFGIIGGVSAPILILVGLFTGSGSLFSYSSVSFLWDWIALAILGVCFIIMGSASIAVREHATHSGAATAAGILSIIGGVLLIIIIGFVGFALIFVAFLLWAIVFYGTEA